jgi:diguanylate cyclase (GGDEF)-like protein
MKKILIVDDSRTILKRLANSIHKQLKLDVIQAETMSKCHEKLLKYKTFDIALLDLNLPDAQGSQIIDLVSKYDIPIIVLTGNESNLTDEILKNPNVIDYIIKDKSFAIEQTINMTKRFINNGKYNVLIVDDSKTYSQQIEDICNKYNLKTIASHSAEEALEIIKNNNEIKLVIVDYFMPKMNGLELTSELRKLYTMDELSIIALSGANEKHLIPKFLKYGANDFIEKSSSMEEIIARLMSNINTLELIEEIKDKANKDFLTGLHNRRYLFDIGKNIYEKSKKEKLSICTAILDIDNFKKINDTYGHDIGDIAIQTIANNLVKYMPKNSILARLGGEEFCVLVPNIKNETIFKALDLLRIATQDNTLQIGDISFNYTISIGVTFKYGKNIDEMLKKADEALYMAKSSGRNKIITA